MPESEDSSRVIFDVQWEDAAKVSAVSLLSTYEHGYCTHSKVFLLEYLFFILVIRKWSFFLKKERKQKVFHTSFIVLFKVKGNHDANEFKEDVDI